MKLSILIVVIFLPLYSQGIPTELPDWLNQIDKVLHRFDKVLKKVSDNTAWYQESQKQLSQTVFQFDKAQMQREHIILCVANAVRNLNSNLMLCQSNVLSCQAQSLNAQSVCDLHIVGLQDNIHTLEGSIDLLEASIQLIGQQAQATIDSLNLQIISLHDELISIEDHFDHLICFDETKAEALICHIHALQNQYHELIANRAHLVDTIDYYNGRTASCIKNAHMDFINTKINEHE